ncbi:MAG: hypothetical protein H7Y43_16370 [Akkermansiaceae bacterium]|nr:hypothetical protein [Verrucomicrobiales bacterium]
MDLEALVNVQFKSAAGLTGIDSRRMTMTMTELEARDLQQSGAKDYEKLCQRNCYFRTSEYGTELSVSGRGHPI